MLGMQDHVVLGLLVVLFTLVLIPIGFTRLRRAASAATVATPHASQSKHTPAAGPDDHRENQRPARQLSSQHAGSGVSTPRETCSGTAQTSKASTPASTGKSKSRRRGQSGSCKNISKQVDDMCTDAGTPSRAHSPRVSELGNTTNAMKGQRTPAHDACHESFLLLPPSALYAAACTDRNVTPNLQQSPLPLPAMPHADLAAQHQRITSLVAGNAAVQLGPDAPAASTGKTTSSHTQQAPAPLLAAQQASAAHVSGTASTPMIPEEPEEHASRSSLPPTPKQQPTPPSKHLNASQRSEAPSIEHHAVDSNLRTPSMTTADASAWTEVLSVHASKHRDTAAISGQHHTLRLPLPLAGDSVSSMHPPFLKLPSSPISSQAASQSGASAGHGAAAACALRAPTLPAASHLLSRHTEKLVTCGPAGPAYHEGPSSAPGGSQQPLPMLGKSHEVAGERAGGSGGGASSSSGGGSGSLVSPSGSSGTASTAKKKEKKSNPIASIGSSLLATIRERSASGSFLSHATALK